MSKIIQQKGMLIISKETILASSDYNLSGDRYRTTTDYTNAKWPMVELGEVCYIVGGSTPLRTDKDFWDGGTVPWFTVDDIRKNGRII